jgi:hypothetical protein|tara:strand:+ start:160 stop:378 length:219 start_codon:yes stop_codon:yes gene_type:complete
MADYLIVSVPEHEGVEPVVLDHVEDVDSLKAAVDISSHVLIPGEFVDVYRVFAGPRRVHVVETVTRSIVDVV